MNGSKTNSEGAGVWLALLLLAVAVYLHGLGGQYVPTNGDEMVYAHIARVTAQTEHWLPLASELDGTRNTKPPMLFWQAMVAGDWGQNWTMAALRAPSLLYTLLVTLLVALSVRRITRQSSDALLAACIFLAFLSTFRYGRPYLTSAPETFWFSLPLFALLGLRPSASLYAAAPPPSPGLGLSVLLGLGLGVGLAYKSFALIAPAAMAWWMAWLLSEPHLTWRQLGAATLKVGLGAALALGVFGLWFALDPDPRSVWQEFVVGENAGKFKDAQGYWHEALLGGGSSMWAQLLSYAFNAGLLALAVVGLMVHGLRRLPDTLRQRRLPPHLGILLAWAGVWLLVFTLPSQRSARYVIPAMPAVAMLLALYWRAIARAWFVPTFALAALGVVMMGRIAWVTHSLGLSTALEWSLILLSMAATVAAIVLGVLRPAWSRAAALLCALLCYAQFAFTVAPLDGSRGLYAPDTAQALPAQARIAVPNSFNGQFERFQFLLPGRFQFQPYETGARAIANVAPDKRAASPQAELQQLLKDYDAVVWIQSSPQETRPLCLPQCQVLGERWLFKSRHLPNEIRADNLWQPQEWLFRREWLLRQAPSPARH